MYICFVWASTWFVFGIKQQTILHGMNNIKAAIIFTQITGLFSGAFAKLRKATISFTMSACLSVHSIVSKQQLGSHWKDYHGIW
jgi:hypothetical protein